MLITQSLSKRNKKEAKKIGKFALIAVCMMFFGLPVLSTEVKVSTWVDLNTAVTNGDNATFTGDITANTSDSSITVGNDIVINMADKYINAQASDDSKRRIFSVSTGKTLTLYNGTLKNATGNGGAIYNNGTANIYNSTFENNFS